MAVISGKSLERGFNLAKPHLEKILIEQNLDSILRIPILRQLFNISPPLMVSALSFLIGELKESMDQHPWIKASIDLLEVIPREVGRILEENVGGTAVKQAGDPASVMAEAIRSKKQKKESIKTANQPLPESVLAVLDKKFAGKGRINHFIKWFSLLDQKSKRKVETYIFTDSARLGIFLAVGDSQKNLLVRKLPEIVPARTPDPNFVSVFTGQITKRMRKGAGKKKKVKQYGSLSQFAYAFTGNPIDEQGRRKR